MDASSEISPPDGGEFREFLLFSEDFSGIRALVPHGFVTHFLCTDGAMSFLHRQTRYHVAPGDYAILPHPALAGDFAASDDFRALVMAIRPEFLSSIVIRSRYGVVGHLALLQNPVMRMRKAEFDRSMEDLARIRERLAEAEHRFHQEMIGHLLAAHILDLYHIHSRERSAEAVSPRTLQKLAAFLELLSQGAARRHRDLGWYAERLFVTPSYLSEICRRASGQGASCFIELYAAQEIARTLCNPALTITEAAEALGFSSVSYFSRFTTRCLGMSPKAFRQSKAE